MNVPWTFVAQHNVTHPAPPFLLLHSKRTNGPQLPGIKNTENKFGSSIKVGSRYFEVEDTPDPDLSIEDPGFATHNVLSVLAY